MIGSKKTGVHANSAKICVDFFGVVVAGYKPAEKPLLSAGCMLY